MILLALALKQKQVYISGSQTYIYYSFDSLNSGTQLNIKVTNSPQYYFFALCSQSYLEGLNIQLAYTGSPDFVGIVYQTRIIHFRLSTFVVYQLPAKSIALYSLLSDEITIFHCNISFITASQEFKVPLLQSGILSITDENGSIIQQFIHAGTLNTPPCVTCVVDEFKPEENCFGCEFGAVNVNQRCECSYNGSFIDNTTGRCENVYQDLVSFGAQSYFAECLSNAQLTIKYSGSPTTNQVSVLKDDACGLVNLFIEGQLAVSGQVEYVSGLVRYASNNIQYIYSSIAVEISSWMQQISSICNEALANVTITGITLIGKLQSSAGNSTATAGGIASKLGAGIDLILTKLRFQGYIVNCSNQSHVSLMIGMDNGANVDISDVFISHRSTHNLTAAPVSPDGLDFAQVTFPCKDKAQSEDIKNSLRLQLYFRQHTANTTNSTLLYRLSYSGGVVGEKTGGSLSAHNIIVNLFANYTLHSTSGAVSNGNFAGQLNNVNLSISNTYFNGSAHGYRFTGLIGKLVNGTTRINFAANIYLDGDQTAGLIAHSTGAVITDAKVAVNIYKDSYCWYAATFGQPVNSNFTISEAFGFFQVQNYDKLYTVNAGTTQINGKTISANTTQIDGLSINNC